MGFKKPRSPAQIAQLKSNHEKLHKKPHPPSTSSLNTSAPVSPSPLELTQKELEESNVKFKEVSSQVAKVLKGEAKAVQELEEVRSQATETITSLKQETQQKIKEIEAAGLQEVEELQAELEELQTRAEDAEEGTQRLQAKLGKELERLDKLKHQNNALRMSKAHTPQKQQNAVAEGARVLLKEGGVITEDTQEGIRDLVSLNIPVENINSATHTVARMLGSNVADSIDKHSVSHIVLEGLVAADMQSMREAHDARAISLSNDRTTNKHLNYESRHGLMVVPTYAPGSDPSARLPRETIRMQRFFGVSQAANHQSDTQLQGWVDMVQAMHDTYNESYMGKAEPWDWRVFTQMVKGMCTNHANDQKKLFQLFGNLKTNYEAELLGEASFQSPNRLEDMCLILAEEIEHCIEDAGGEEEWEALTVEE
ncbi:hypothetical protein BOTBODRAFT_176720 [Botryobasidium botryosum FD-172 SS1]|uniref:Uncharacterized protein n=1 Tax=Botryobasidium botryosum (strain FD-172 SS1) TaxID=930990 RepID=A0A067M8U8_BOTB1|nr:hypothetical protein BOTBODRAFT_176720 [Botryobasidium botryosum FD-172 SS1]